MSKDGTGVEVFASGTSPPQKSARSAAVEARVATPRGPDARPLFSPHRMQASATRPPSSSTPPRGTCFSTGRSETKWGATGPTTCWRSSRTVPQQEPQISAGHFATGSATVPLRRGSPAPGRPSPIPTCSCRRRWRGSRGPRRSRRRSAVQVRPGGDGAQRCCVWWVPVQAQAPLSSSLPHPPATHGCRDRTQAGAGAGPSRLSSGPALLAACSPWRQPHRRRCFLH